MKTFTLKQKLVLAAVLLGLLPVVVLLQSGSAVAAARLAAGLCVVATLAFWLFKGHRRAFALPARLSIVGRVGLSPRAGLALVQVDGVTWLVAHGDGYAQLQRTSAAPRSPRLVTDEMEQVDLRVLGGAS